MSYNIVKYILLVIIYEEEYMAQLQFHLLLKWGNLFSSTRHD
jgi:hypothetical protein